MYSKGQKLYFIGNSEDAMLLGLNNKSVLNYGTEVIFDLNNINNPLKCYVSFNSGSPFPQSSSISAVFSFISVAEVNLSDLIDEKQAREIKLKTIISE